MLPLDDPRWAKYSGGYGDVYDASKTLSRIIRGDNSNASWQELWDELHHQGDVGAASYAAVPWLVEITRTSPLADWTPLALVCTIELARPNNSEVPEEIHDGYFKAIKEIPSALAEKPCYVWNDIFTQVAAASLALSRQHRAFAEIYLEFSFEEAKKWYAEHFDVEQSQLHLPGL